MNLTLIRDNIIKELESRGIKCDADVCFPGLIVDKLLARQADRNTFAIGIGKPISYEQESDYNIVFVPSGYYITNLFDDEKVSEDHKAVTTFLNMNGTRGVKIFTGKRNGKELLVVSLSTMDDAAMVHVTSLLPAIFKSAFTEKSVKANQDFLKSLSTVSFDDCLNILTEKCDHIDFESMYREHLAQGLSNCFKYQNTVRAQRINSTIMDLKGRIDSLTAQRSELVSQLNDYLYIQSHGNDDDNDDNKLFIDYLLNNRQVEIISTQGNTIRLAISTYLLSYDELAYESCAESGRTNYFYNIPAEHEAKMKKLCHEIFVDQKYRVRSKTQFEMTIDYVSKIKSLRDEPDMSERRIISPHAYYNCYGDFPTLWDESLKNQNYIGAIDYMTSFAGNINWSDGAVAKYLIESIYLNQCVEDADGNIYSGKQLIEKEK